MANIIAKGAASIIINPQETEVKLLFAPDPEGLGWDIDALVKLIGEQRLVPPPQPKSLEPFLQKAAKVKTRDPMESVICRGIPPEEAAPEQIAWEALPIPGDIAPHAAAFLARARTPELYRTRIEKIKREKLVKKPAKLPFMPPKEELVISWDKKEIQEEVQVNPELKETKYAQKGKKLGTFIPAKPGKPGKNVFGKPIPPAIPEDGAFHLGMGLARDKNDIRSLYSGIIRIGENWADVIPLAKPVWSVFTGSDNVTPFLRFEPGDRVFPPPKAAEILAAALDQGADKSSLAPLEAVEAAIQQALNTGEEIAAFSLFQVREAEARVEITADKMRAELYLRKGVAGARPLEMKAVSQVIRDSRVRGFDAEKLKAAIRGFVAGRELELRYTLAEGRAAARGKDKEIELLAALLPEEEKAALLERLKVRGGPALPDTREGFPLSEASGLGYVEKGAVAARITRPPEGETGMDIFGVPLPGLPGNDPELRLFGGLHQRGSDIVADEPGLLLIKASAKSFWARIIDYRDSVARVSLSADAMEASADIYREQGAGEPLKQETILKALDSAGVSRGIDREALEKAFRRALEEGSCTGQILARGEPPVPAGGTAVKWLVPVIEVRGGAGKPGEGATGIPKQTLSVNQNTVLAELRPVGPEGRAGFDVSGKTLPPEQGISQDLHYDDSIKTAAMEGGERLIAARSGELSFNGKELRISAFHGIRGDVGPATGNINFPGEIRITGNVNPGFTVMGGKDVLIGGSVESALISSGGRVVISQGVIGGGKGAVRARSTIEVSFVEQATLLAVEDIRVKNSCVSCNIKTNGLLWLAEETGSLAGGVCRARQGLNAANIGSEQRRQTEISFGQDYLVKDQIEVTEAEIEKIKLKLAQVEQKIQGAAQIPPALEAARAEKVKLMQLLEQHKLKIFTLREKFEEHHPSEIRVRGTIYPGVVMESHDRYYEITRERRRVIFYFDRESGRIQEKGL